MASNASVLTWEVFEAQMGRLLGLKFAPKEFQTHWEALNDMEAVMLTAAVDHAQKVSDEFPSPKMLRMYAGQMRSKVVTLPPVEDRSEPNPAPVEHRTPTGKVLGLKRFWKYYCEDCSDSGWFTFWCHGMASGGEEFASTPRKPWLGVSRPCDRQQRPHGEHEWVAECACVATNPDVQRKRERERQIKRGAKDGE